MNNSNNSNKLILDNTVTLKIDIDSEGNTHYPFKQFAEELIKGSELFNSLLLSEQSRWEKLNPDVRELNNVFITPERLVKVSPLAILNAGWGMGKTHFLEDFVSDYTTEKSNNNLSKEYKSIGGIIMFDAWKYSNVRDVNEAFLVELSNNLSDMLCKSKGGIKARHITKNIVNFLLPDSVNVSLGLGGIPIIKHFTGSFSLQWNRKLKKKNTAKLVNKIDNLTNKEKIGGKIIVIIDNIERLGQDAWSVLKTIIKLQEIENLIVVLPMSINKIDGPDNGSDGEYPIVKYVDMPILKLEQNYVPFLKSVFNKYEHGDLNDYFENYLANIINDYFNAISENNKSLPTLRAVEKYLTSKMGELDQRKLTAKDLIKQLNEISYNDASAVDKTNDQINGYIAYLLVEKNLYLFSALEKELKTKKLSEKDENQLKVLNEFSAIKDYFDKLSKLPTVVNTLIQNVDDERIKKELKEMSNNFLTASQMSSKADEKTTRDLFKNWLESEFGGFVDLENPLNDDRTLSWTTSLDTYSDWLDCQYDEISAANQDDIDYDYIMNR